MSDRPIQVGDLVRIARPTVCCGSLDSVGVIFTVTQFGTVDECAVCGKTYPPAPTVIGDSTGGLGVLIERVRRIPPIEELKGERATIEEHHAAT